ncbi:hypothetical protein BU23DRAFT_155220 [Bimuria novae-zelandiae CBS 107.79]|uniref:Uncharacterized protein n=1 Tax=Bimuria novae-zelandiae CBS 107.79 TaxID=1447943 RepID=A0A6A5V6Z4_9PLEO|nr:hypothetical protein BU23DRAFT_155220 [Bimuria novae-zelandiae CBS 107.79]
MQHCSSSSTVVCVCRADERAHPRNAEKGQHRTRRQPSATQVGAHPTPIGDPSPRLPPADKSWGARSIRRQMSSIQRLAIALLILTALDMFTICFCFMQIVLHVALPFGAHSCQRLPSRPQHMADQKQTAHISCPLGQANPVLHSAAGVHGNECPWSWQPSPIRSLPPRDAQCNRSS